MRAITEHLNLYRHVYIWYVIDESHSLSRNTCLTRPERTVWSDWSACGTCSTQQTLLVLFLLWWKELWLSSNSENDMPLHRHHGNISGDAHQIYVCDGNKEWGSYHFIPLLAIGSQNQCHYPRWTVGHSGLKPREAILFQQNTAPSHMAYLHPRILTNHSTANMWPLNSPDLILWTWSIVNQAD